MKFFTKTHDIWVEIGGKVLIYKYIQIMQTLQGYIFRILQHFATKLCNFTNFKDALSSRANGFHLSTVLDCSLHRNFSFFYLIILRLFNIHLQMRAWLLRQTVFGRRKLFIVSMQQ